MSSHLSSLNASTSCKFNKFNLKDIQVLVDKEDQLRFKQTYIVKFLGLCDIDISTAKLEQDSKQMRGSLEIGSSSHRCDEEGSWPGHKDQQY